MKKVYILILCSICFAKAQVFSSATIAPFNTGQLITKVIDFDNDGDDDVLTRIEVTGITPYSLNLYRNNGNSNFTNVSTLLNLNTSMGRGSVLGIYDFNKDGYLDITSFGGGNMDTIKIIANNNGASFTNFNSNCGIFIVKQLINAPSSTIQGVYFSDFNTDGIFDLIVDAYTAPNQHVLLGKKGVINCNSCIKFGFSATPSQTLITINNNLTNEVNFPDINNDGKFDLLIMAGTNYQNFTATTYTNNGLGVYTQVNLNITTGRGSLALGEFNNDGYVDFYTGAPDCCVGNNPLYMYFSNANNLTYSTSTTALLRVNNPYYGGNNSIDLNLDKKMDVVWCSMTAVGSSALQFHLNNGNNTFTESASIYGINYGPNNGNCCPLQNNQASTIIDFNNDLKPDIDIHEIDNTAPYTYTNTYQRINTSTNKAVKLKLNACNGLQEGYGARIKYKTTTGWSYQQKNLTLAWMNNHPNNFLGLGTANQIDSLVVFWVGGQTTTLTSIPSNTYIVINENLNCNTLSNPNIQVVGNIPVCSGNNLTLTATGANTYTWSNTSTSNSIIITPTSNITYSVNGTNSVGCTAANAAIASITVLAKPNIIVPNKSICLGETTTLTATGANTYTWSNALNTNTIVVTPSITSIYSVTGTGTNNCINTASVQVTVNPCTSIKDQSLNQLSIYPNPAKTQITLNATTNQIGKTLKVYDALGKVVYESIIKQEQSNISINHWANGIYTVAIPEQDLTYKFVKE